LLKKKTHKAYLALAKICSSTALLVLSMTFFWHQELCTYKFCALNLSTQPQCFAKIPTILATKRVSILMIPV